MELSGYPFNYFSLFPKSLAGQYFTGKSKILLTRPALPVNDQNTQINQVRPQNMHVALLKASDAKQYRELMLEAYELAADAFTSTAAEREAEPDSFWIRRIADPTDMSAAFGTFDGQKLTGTVALEFSAKPKTRHKALVIGMYVAPASRGNGAGRALVSAIVEFARAKEMVSMLTLTVTEGNAPAVNLYSSFGFQPFGVEPMAILTPTGFKSKIHMWLPLRRNAMTGRGDR